ncbi:16S rRNA (cytidine(1402)-2'-O)-methyltransferase [Salinispira pacifica]|uniref:Ribosomal RNA small subunit methyltransferase I n=1 Tax=Salinispira pacifica TaxID=1307761 RepID=V5WCS5_9SPIO|nr:16S rRNA (cytidine(1402)-2'-O)-methyltransferase [Salinispira pacifica]AHC13577.1 rRNA small subunit methyltransferase I [Salinispira pacifica]
MAVLYVVGTPIGNLKDITLRALEVLQEVEVVACEDTRHSMRLLNAHGIRKRLIPCHARNEAKSAQGIVALLNEGKNVAYISDAGTPGISDPGSQLVRAVRDAGHSTVPIPGASAVTAMMSITAFPGKRVIFEGFLSPKGGRRKNQLKNLMETGDAFIIYESPFRIVKMLQDLDDLCGEMEDPRSVLCGRELTKVHEEIMEGNPGDIRAELENRPSVKGEFAVLVAPREKRP